MARRKTISQSAALLLLLGLLTGGVILVFSERKPKSESELWGSGSVAGVAPGTRQLSGTEITRVEEAAADQTVIRLGLYTPYLDKLCPRLTLAEEERIVAESGRDPRVMLGCTLPWNLQE